MGKAVIASPEEALFVRYPGPGIPSLSREAIFNAAKPFVKSDISKVDKQKIVIEKQKIGNALRLMKSSSINCELRTSIHGITTKTDKRNIGNEFIKSKEKANGRKLPMSQSKIKIVKPLPKVRT